MLTEWQLVCRRLDYLDHVPGVLPTHLYPFNYFLSGMRMSPFLVVVFLPKAYKICSVLILLVKIECYLGFPRSYII